MLEEVLQIVKNRNTPVLVLCNYEELPIALNLEKTHFNVGACDFIHADINLGKDKLDNSKIFIGYWPEEIYKKRYQAIWEVLWNNEQHTNNMYSFGEVTSNINTWTCPACSKKGQYTNNKFGACKNKQCLCISLEKPEHDTSVTQIRRPFVIHLNNKYHANVTKTFYTDGSGKRLSRELDVMTTGWAAVEVRPVIENISSKEQKLVYKK